MKKIPHIMPGYIMTLFFLIGLISAFAFRTIIVWNDINPGMVRPVWYFGTIGYIIFFLYRYSITKKRKKAVTEYDLIHKIKSEVALKDEEKKVAVYLLSSINKSRENLNYLFIFILSLAAILADIFLHLKDF